ncbi:MAG: hypothetical protein CMJ83_02685 [Planctomycetes bacterium]|nr:hypothetical protein [Planctomycetota bacterium]
MPALRHALLSLLLVAISWGQSAGDPTDVMFVNGRVMTMDSRVPRADSVLVRGERIVAIGIEEDVRSAMRPGGKVVDLDGKLVVPGFNDSHSHFTGGSRLLRQLNLYGVDTLAKVLKLVKESVDRAQPGEWIYGSRYDHTLWGDRWPTKQDLDRVAPDNPVVLRRASGHSVWVNSLALKISGITSASKDPPAGEIQRDSKTRQPTGILLESAAGLVRGRRRGPQLTREQRRKRLEADLIAGFRHAARRGVTSVQTSSSLREMEVIRELKAQGKLTLRWTGWLPLRQAAWLGERGVVTGQGDNWVRVGFLKGYIDGTLGDGTAAMFDPFIDRPDFDGLPTMNQKKLDAMVVEADRLGFQIGIHAIGDKGVHMVLNAFERAARVNGTKDRRHRVEHAQVIHKDDLRRFARLGVIASMQPTHCTTDMRFAETRIGRLRCRTAYPWRSLLDSGAKLAFGTDWSVEPLDPMRGVYSAVTRTNIQRMEPKTGWFPEQKLTAWEAVYHYTVGSAYGEHLEDVKGSLAPGRLADFVVLDHDVFTIPHEKILETKVVMTVVGGKTVYDGR